MNTSALKSFAPAVRRQLMEAVERKLDVVLTAEAPDYRTTYAEQVETLRKRAHEDRPDLIERVAYTWFNRLAALRYLDAHGWHPFRARVLTPASPEETQPELLRLMRTGALPEELHRHTDLGRLNDLLDGRIPSADPQGEAYRHLVLAACRFYHALLPDLFESLDDETELLLPDDLLTEHSIASGFRTEITDEDCAEVELLGWLYQFYIAEKKDAVMARKSAVPSEDIPAVTQLFTPHWIVRYLLENSLGRLWMLNRPGSRLRERMPYYIEGEAEADFLKISGPEEIRLIDPAVGSGHMLTYAFDLLHAIYEEEGYAPSEIPGLILKHNLYGAEIDLRAAQLASLALVLKGREKARRFFQAGQMVQPNVIALKDVHFSDAELREYVSALDLGELFAQPVLELLRQFENVTTLGSLIQPVLEEMEVQQLRQQIEVKELGSEMFQSETHQKVLQVLKLAEHLTQRYHVVVANPPYMGSKQMNDGLQRFARARYPDSKSDLFAMFIERGFDLVPRSGWSAMVTMQTWMFLSSYEAFRERILKERTIHTLLHMGNNVMGIAFGTAATVWEKRHRANHHAHFSFVRHGDLDASNRPRSFPVEGNRLVWANPDEFTRIPGRSIAYWLSTRTLAILQEFEGLETWTDFKQGMSTTDSERFVRLWHEVSRNRIGFTRTRAFVDSDEGAAWYPFNKGGSFRKWYGNLDHVVRYERNGEDLIRLVRQKYPRISDPEFVIKNRGRYFQPGVTYSSISSSHFGVRYVPEGFIFSVAGPMIFPESGRIPVILSLLCSKTTTGFLEAINPSMGFQGTDLAKIPVRADLFRNASEEAARIATTAIQLARADWDNFETSWNFSDLPLLRPGLKGQTLSDSWAALGLRCDTAVRQMQQLETENNRLWIQAYSLQEELFPEVPEDQITLARADRRQDMAAFLSYAVGCMMGRYSLDAPGLLLADAGDTLVNYLGKVGKPQGQLMFAPDEDGIIPVLDGEWFEDDVVARTRDFLRATFGEATLRENLRFLEESLGKDLRRYFLTDFYKDHLQTYKKRPIYWLVQSPKKGFSALIYLHRYTKDTMNLVLNRYLREYQAKLRDRLAHLERAQADPGIGARETTAARKESGRLTKVLHECEEWERKTLLPLAQARIELDLDDGVKVNYLKLGEGLAPIPGFKAKGDD